LAGCIIEQSLIFSNSDLWLNLSISVLIVSHYDIYLKDAGLDALSPSILQFAIRSIFVELLQKTLSCRCYFTAIKQMVIELQIRELDVKEHLKQHLLCIYYIVIQSELNFLI